MKKKLFAFMSVILVVASIATITVFATKAIREESLYEQRLRNSGFTEQDRWELEAIRLFSDENVSALIVNKYKELKDWDKVREYYNVDKKEYDKFIEGKKRRQEVLDTVPKYIFDEMEQQNWTRKEVDDFVNKISVLDIDYEYAWGEMKTGKSVDEIVDEKRVVNKAKSELMTEFIYSEMDEKEYKEKLSKAYKTNEKELEKEVKKAEKIKKETHERHKKESGITDAEIEFCKSQGMTNPMDMYQAKNISKGIKSSLDKVVKAKVKNKDWTKATSEILNIPYEERKGQIENIKKQIKETK